jgi:phosphoglycolate phosphatase-like HAD superfamily hydrolase
MNYSVAFDLDGTLIDLPVDIESARAEIAALFAEHGYHEPMRPILDAINKAAASVAETDADIFPLIIKARNMLDLAEVEAAQKATARPGALRAIERLLQAGVSLGLCTNNSRACVAPALLVLGLRAQQFSISTRDDVRRPKPAPDGLIRIASVLGDRGQDMWYIGDSPVDVSAAVAANHQVAPNLRAIAVPGPRSSLQQLRMSGPCIVYDTLDEAIDRIINGD